MPTQTLRVESGVTATTYRELDTQPLTRRRPGRITLKILKGPGAPREVTASGTRVVVGRSRSADIVLEHPSVSGAHFELRLGPDGIELRDLESTNGTRLGTTRIHHATIEPGTPITVGECQVALTSVDDVEVDVSAESQLCELYGCSEPMRELFAKLVKLADTPLYVLITGETGTGKELAARALHQCSSRAQGPWTVLDCGTQGPTMVESVLFGYRRGAFTGAEADRPGLIEAADGGTLFIDEIGELPLDLQVKLLRALDRREVTRIGETRPRRVDIRVIAATHRNLMEMVAKGTFRDDLFFRLSQAQVEIPPLRDRGEDVLFLAERFLDRVSHERGLKLRLSAASKRELVAHRWRGNVRELKNIVERDGYLADRTEVTLELRSMPAAGDPLLERIFALNYQDMRDVIDREYLARVMTEAKGNISAAAERIGIDRTTLRNRLKQLNMYCRPYVSR